MQPVRTDVLIDMFMVGRNKTKSSSAILVSCGAKSARLLIRKIIEEKVLLCHYPGVLTAGCSRFPHAFKRGEKDIDDFFGSLNLEAQLHARSISSFLPESELGCGISVTLLAREHSTSRNQLFRGLLKQMGSCMD